ncbi:MAG: ABC transporter substrate-binding protein [Chloroflexota bacterium]|nr:ABC transporter substrate-binding protein [Chloroflexota bacterium]
MAADSRVLRRRWLILAAGIALLVATLLLIWRATSQPSDRFWDNILRSGQWRVAMDPSFPPFEDLGEDGQPVGFDVDLAQEIADRWGVELQIEGVGFDGLIDVVWASRVDSVISAVPYQPLFSEDVAFSQPYFEAGLVLVTNLESVNVQSVDDLAGRSVAVEWGSEGDVQARALQRRFPDLQIQAKETPADALRAVATGTAQAALVDHVSALQFQGQGGLVTIAPEVIVSDPYVVVMPRKAPRLQQEIGLVLEEMAADGTLERLTDRWFVTR